jgi:hypothetical protein
MSKTKRNETYCKKEENNIENGMEIKPLEQQDIHVLTFIKAIIYEYISEDKRNTRTASVDFHE